MEAIKICPSARSVHFGWTRRNGNAPVNLLLRLVVGRCNVAISSTPITLRSPSLPPPLSLSDSASRLQRAIMSPIRLELNAIHRPTYKMTPPRPTHSKAVSVCNNRFFTLLPSRSSVLSHADNFNRRSRLPLSVDLKNKGNYDCLGR